MNQIFKNINQLRNSLPGHACNMTRAVVTNQGKSRAHCTTRERFCPLGCVNGHVCVTDGGGYDMPFPCSYCEIYKVLLIQ